MIKFETIELMEKLSRGRKYRKEQKKYLGGKCLYGYKVNDYGFFEENEEESKIVTYIFDIYSKGKTSASVLENELAEKGIISRNNKPLTSQFISKIIRTEDYFNGKTYPPIITEKVFNICREISIQNNISQPKERQIHLGSKILKCRDCGHGFTTLSSKSGTYYYCIGYRMHKCSTDAKVINQQIMDFCLKRTTINIYSQIIFQKNKEDISSYQNQIDEKNNRISVIKDTISKTEKKIKRINDLYINGSYLNEEDYRKDYEQQMSIRNNSLIRQKELENEIKSIQKQISIIKHENENGLRKYMNIRKDLLEITDITQIKQMVDISIEKAYLKKVFVLGKIYTAIIIVSVLDNNEKSVYLCNRRKLYQVTYLENNPIMIIQMDYQNNTTPKLLTSTITLEEYQQIIS